MKWCLYVVLSPTKIPYPKPIYHLTFISLSTNPSTLAFSPWPSSFHPFTTGVFSPFTSISLSNFGSFGSGLGCWTIIAGNVRSGRPREFPGVFAALMVPFVEDFSCGSIEGFSIGDSSAITAFERSSVAFSAVSSFALTLSRMNLINRLA